MGPMARRSGQIAAGARMKTYTIKTAEIPVQFTLCVAHTQSGLDP